ncbi:MAG TPA: insulinase family protein [Bacteroidales bacterium]|nr:insulinase family protein [Bacteroidales bacterium]
MKTATSGISAPAEIKLPDPVRFNLSNGIPCTLLTASVPAQAKLIIRFNHPSFFALHYPAAKLACLLFGDAVSARLSRYSLDEMSSAIITNHRIAPDHASLECIFPEEKLGELLNLIRESFHAPDISVDMASRHKEMLLKNCLESRMLPRNRASELLMEQLFSGQPGGNALRPDQISSVDVTNPAALLLDLLQAATPRVYLAVHNTRTAKLLLERVFGSLHTTTGDPDTRKDLPQTDELPRTNGSRIHMEMEPADTGSIRMGRRIFGMEHPLYPAARMSLAILGGYFSSRLMSRLREHKGYAHGIGAGIRSLSTGSYLFISAEVGAPWLNDALREIDSELNRLATETVEKEEFATVLHYLEAGIFRQTNQLFSYLDFLATLDHLHLEPGWHMEFVRNINNLNPTAINRFMQEFMNPADLITITCGKAPLA